MKRKKRPKIWSPDGYIFAALRKIWRWSPERKRALKYAEVKGQFICAECKLPFDREGIAVDHRTPVVDPFQGFQGWDCYVNRLFTTAENLQVLCKACHKIKTQKENAERRKHK